MSVFDKDSFQNKVAGNVQQLKVHFKEGMKHLTKEQKTDVIEFRLREDIEDANTSVEMIQKMDLSTLDLSSQRTILARLYGILVGCKRALLDVENPHLSDAIDSVHASLVYLRGLLEKYGENEILSIPVDSPVSLVEAAASHPNTETRKRFQRVLKNTQIKQPTNRRSNKNRNRSNRNRSNRNGRTSLW